MMKKKSCKFTPRSWIILGIAFLFLAACNTEYQESCPSYNLDFDLSKAETYPIDDSLPFQFPLDEYEPGSSNYKSSFVMRGRSSLSDPYQYHAAEDSYDPPGTPVYAMADGRIGFSGRAGGYGWLIIIDHPQVNLYSLYGHLSPSRWRQESGTNVKRGDLIAYLEDDYENGGSEKDPLVPHLHFGIRAGQIADYPGKGEWRWTAGWIRLCPQDAGWLQPSLIITSQEIPAGGYPRPEVDFLTRWGLELIITIAYGLGGAAMVLMGIKKKLIFYLLFPGPVITLASIIFYRARLVGTPALLGVGIVVMTCGIYAYSRQSKQKGQG
ncbi:MAG TPA: M23 family metallopeptidase [Anaerolineales bacterium]